MTTEIDLTALSLDQLAGLQTVLPTLTPQIRSERRRRSAYESLSEGFSALAKASLALEHVLAGMKGTQATVAVKDSNILEIANRLLATAEVNDIRFAVDAGEVHS